MDPTVTLNVVLGGPNQFGQIAVTHGLTSRGTLNITLTNGYLPAIGTQFQIMSCANKGGETFATLNVPPGISVTYSNTGVFLVVTGSVLVDIKNPQVSGSNFVFNFATINNQSYTIQQNTNLATANWTFFTNITGDGSLFQFATPATNFPQRFFRIRQP